jgi:hypothetical protein
LPGVMQVRRIANIKIHARSIGSSPICLGRFTFRLSVLYLQPLYVLLT